MTPPTTDTGATAEVVGGLRLVDPRELLTDRNIREAQLTREFVADVAESGVRVPIVARATSEGGLRVRLGHRRTLAAVEAGRATVPVLVELAEDEGRAGEVGRIVDQFAENEHRAALTVAERVGVVEQLTAFGVTPALIAKRLRVLKRPQVDAALQVAASETARAALARYELTLEQAAGLAEFDAAPEVAEMLLEAAEHGPGRFDHLLQRARDQRAAEHRRDQAAEVMRAAGVAVLEGRAPSYNSEGKVRLRAPPRWRPAPRRTHSRRRRRAGTAARLRRRRLHRSVGTSERVVRARPTGAALPAVGPGVPTILAMERQPPTPCEVRERRGYPRPTRRLLPLPQRITSAPT